MLDIRSLNKAFGSLRVTDDLSLSVPAGARHCIIGPNGAGKSTLVNLISGDLFPDSGEILFDGKPITRLKPWQRAALGMSRTYQISTGFPEMTLAENMLLALKRSDSVRRNVMTDRYDYRADLEVARTLLRDTGLQADLLGKVRNVSYGEVKQLELAMALSSAPRLLILDEPLAGVSKEESAQIVSIIRKVPREITVVLIEHDMDAVFQIADTITVLVEGRELVTGPAQAVRTHPQVRAAYLGDE